MKHVSAYVKCTLSRREEWPNVGSSSRKCRSPPTSFTGCSLVLRIMSKTLEMQQNIPFPECIPIDTKTASSHMLFSTANNILIYLSPCICVFCLFLKLWSFSHYCPCFLLFLYCQCGLLLHYTCHYDLWYYTYCDISFSCVISFSSVILCDCCIIQFYLKLP